MARLCELVSPLGESLKFASMRVDEGLSRLFEIHLEAVSEKQDVDPKALLGKPITVRITYDDGTKRFFNGYATQMSLGGSRGRFFTYRLVLRPWLWFLTRTSDCRIFQEQSVPDIVKKVFDDEGATSFVQRLSGTHAAWEYCVQYRETDFNFVSRLLEQEGIYYFFEHADGVHKLVLVDSKGEHPFVEGDATLPFVPAERSQSQPRDHISVWDARLGVEPGVYAIDDYDFKRPQTQLDVMRKPAVPSGFVKADYEIYDWPGDYDTHDEGEVYVEARIEELHGRSIEHHGSGSLRFFTPGARFRMSNHPKKDQNGEYLIASTSYTFTDSTFESGDRAETTFECTFTALPAAQQFRPPRSTPRPLVQGIQTAVVTGPAGEEIHTDKYGRLKVQFHWDRYGKKDDRTSCWMRVAFLAAGARFGFVSIPRIGHEVVVSFLEGDPDRPMVTGVVYNGANMPPWELPGNKTQSGLLTRSSLGGSAANANAIRFEDKKGAEQVWIHAEKNQDIEVENDETHWVGHDRTKKVDHDEKTTVGHDRTESVGNNETITIGANRSERVGSNETIHIGANRTETVGANESVSIGSNRTHTVGAAETLTVATQRTQTVGVNETIAIGAAQEVAIGAAQTIAIGATQSLTVGADRSARIGSDDNLIVGSNRAAKVSSNDTAEVGANHQLKVGGLQSVEVAGDQSIKVGKTIVISAGDAITLKAGSASITLQKDGTIVIKGKDIAVQGSGKIGIKASGDVVVKGSAVKNN